MIKERKGFNFYKSYYDVYEILTTDKDKSEFITAIFNKQFYGLDPEIENMSPMVKLAYISQRHSLDKSVRGYEDKTSTTLQLPLERTLERTFEGKSKPLERTFEQLQEQEQVYSNSISVASVKTEATNPDFEKEPKKQKKQVSDSLPPKYKPAPKTKIRNMVSPTNTAPVTERAVFWFYKTLLPYHNNKLVFRDAIYEKWLKDINTLLISHGRKKDEFKKIVNWAIEQNEIAFMQSPGFLTKHSGKNYDLYLGKMEAKTRPTNEISTFKPRT